MAEIFNFDKRFIHVANKEAFVAKYPNWESEASALGNIIFFKDTCEIWTRGTTYGITPETMQEIEDLRTDLNALTEGVEGLNYVTGFTGNEGTAVVTNGATIVPIMGSGQVKVTTGSDGITIDVPVHTVIEPKSGSAIEVEEDGTVNLLIDEENKGNVTLEITENGLKASATIPEVEYPVTGVASDDKVLSLTTDKEVKSTLSIKYDSDSKKVQLLGKDQTVVSEFDASDFVTDGMLDDVDIIEVIFDTDRNANIIKSADVTDFDPATAPLAPEHLVAGMGYIRFKWNVDGDSKIDYVKTSDLVDLKTKNVEVSESIPVAGGPLASLLNAKGINTIDAGMSMQDLLFTLFCQEQWPNPAAKYAYGTLYSVMSAPTSSYSNNGKVVEIGSTQSIGKVSGKKAGYGNSSSSKQNGSAPQLTFDNFTWGYRTERGKGTATASETNPSAVNATVTTNDVTYTLSRAYTNFDNSSAEDSTSGADGSALYFDAEDLVAKLGENKVVYTLSVSGQVHSATVAAPSVYYAMSNLGNTDKTTNGVASAQQVVDATTTKTFTPSPATPASTTLTYTCTGVYPVYTNASATGNISTASNRIVEDKSVFEVVFGPETNKHHMFKFPASHTLSKVENLNPQNGKFGEYAGGFILSDAEDHKINGTTYSYKTWTRQGPANTEATTYRFTLNKSTSNA